MHNLRIAPVECPFVQNRGVDDARAFQGIITTLRVYLRRSEAEPAGVELLHAGKVGAQARGLLVAVVAVDAAVFQYKVDNAAEAIGALLHGQKGFNFCWLTV